MSYDQAAMAAFAQQVIADCSGRMVTPTGESLNVDGRYGWQCMDLFIYIRYHLGFRDNLPTPDAASVWEMNWTHPDSTMWTVFDGITPDKPCYPGDIGIMNRQFFNNGVGHIFMIVADLGASIRVLELNGLGDGREDAAGNQYGSPARIHDWPKTYLYGYLRWIGPAPTVSTLGDTIIPVQEDEMPYSEQDLTRIFKSAIDDWSMNTRNFDGNRNLLDTFKQLRSENTATVAAVKALPQAVLFDTRYSGRNIFDSFNMLSDNDGHIMAGLLPIAQGIGALKAQPVAAAPAIDVPALAAQIAAALNQDQAHQLLVELGKSLPTQ